MSGGDSSKGDVMITPLYWWSEVMREVAALALDAGKAYAVAIGGSQPGPRQIISLRASLKRVARYLERAERMEAGSQAKFAAVDDAADADEAAAPTEQPAAAPARRARRSA